LKIKPFYLTLIGDLSYSVNKRTKGRIQNELNELCERLEYIEATGDGEPPRQSVKPQSPYGALGRLHRNT